MTRQEALRAAIRLLGQMDQTEEIKDIVSGLKKFEPVSYKRKWTRQSIYETVKMWSEVHGRCPTTKEMEYLRELPGAFAIKREYKMGSREFLNVYFPVKVSKSDCKDRELLDSFIAEYERVKPQSARDYNERKDSGLPTWNAVARRLGLRRWSELLLLSGVELSYLKQKGSVMKSLSETEKRAASRYEIRRHN